MVKLFLLENRMLYSPTMEALVGKELFVAALQSLHVTEASNLLLTIIRDVLIYLPSGFVKPLIIHKELSKN